MRRPARQRRLFEDLALLDDFRLLPTEERVRLLDAGDWRALMEFGYTRDPRAGDRSVEVVCEL